MACLDRAEPLRHKVGVTTTDRTEGCPMHALQSQALLSSETHAMDQLQAFLRQRREAPEPVADLHTFAQELPRLFVAAEREALGQALARFDLDVPVVEVAGERCPRVL